MSFLEHNGEFNPVRKIFDPGFVFYLRLRGTTTLIDVGNQGSALFDRLICLMMWLNMYAYMLNSCYAGKKEGNAAT